MPGRKILIADDELHVTFMLKMKLTRAGAEVTVASDGEEAFLLAMQQRPDLIITDYQMPRLSGFDMALKLRSTPETAEIPLLMLTARGHHISPSDLARTNIRHLIPKPFSVKELLVHVAEFIDLTDAPGNVRAAAA